MQHFRPRPIYLETRQMRLLRPSDHCVSRPAREDGQTRCAPQKTNHTKKFVFVCRQRNPGLHLFVFRVYALGGLLDYHKMKRPVY